MPVAMIWGPPGSGKTVAATASKEGNILHLCSDNSAVSLGMFDRKNVTTERVEHWVDPSGGFAKQFTDGIASGKYSTVVVDNLTDLKELALQEIEDEGKLKDIRQIYQAVYMALKRLTRQAANAQCNVIFTAWSEPEQFTDDNGELRMRQKPNLPPKIVDQVLGLCNVVAFMNSKEKEGKRIWYCYCEGRPEYYGCKDQLFGRKVFMPEDIFRKPEGK